MKGGGEGGEREGRNNNKKNTHFLKPNMSFKLNCFLSVFFFFAPLGRDRPTDLPLIIPLLG